MGNESGVVSPFLTFRARSVASERDDLKVQCLTIYARAGCAGRNWLPRRFHRGVRHHTIGDMMKLFGLDPADAMDKLQTALERSVDGGSVRNAVLHVDAPRLGAQRTWADGVADGRDGRPMRPETPFLSASIGKLAVAAAVFALVDEGTLDLDAPIAAVLARDVLEGLPVAGGEDAITRISARMLLANRSGLPDYYDDQAHPTVDGAPSVAELMLTEPERRWTRDQLLDYVREHYAPFASPGERFLYSDLNWDLLGLVLESATGRPFHAVVRERVLEPLAMTHTWYHAFEPRPDDAPDFADAFVGAREHRTCAVAHRSTRPEAGWPPPRPTWASSSAASRTVGRCRSTSWPRTGPKTP